jgi:LmbE family N-acetylglucosaminyl deacetylase
MISRANQTIVVIAAHPDDEVLGCGGTIAKFASFGWNIKVLFLADGVSSRYPNQDFVNWEKELIERRTCARNASQAMGLESTPIFLDYPDNSLDSIPLLSITREIEAFLKLHNPNLILTHFPEDLNIDHAIVARAAITAARPGVLETVPDLWCFEIPSSSELSINTSARGFLPNTYVDISQTLSKKMKALECYEYEMRKHPHPRSTLAIESLATWRGASICVQAAEAFIVYRQLR